MILKKLLLFLTIVLSLLVLAAFPQGKQGKADGMSARCSADINAQETNNKLLVEFWYYKDDPDSPHNYSLFYSDASIGFPTEMLTQQASVIPVDFVPGASGNYFLLMKNFQPIDNSVNITIEDLKLNKTQNIRNNPVYNFSSEIGDDPGRFVLHFENPLSTENEIPGNPSIQIYTSQSTIFIRNNSKTGNSGNVFMYDLVGKEVFSAELSDSQVNKFRLELNDGYYIVKVVTGTNVQTQKIFLNR